MLVGMFYTRQCTAFLGSQTLKGSEQKIIKRFITKNNIFFNGKEGIRIGPTKAKVQNELKTHFGKMRNKRERGKKEQQPGLFKLYLEKNESMR